MMSVLENSRKSSTYVAPIQLICRAMGMVTTVVIARNLSVEVYGIYNLFLGSILIFSFFTNFGIAGSLQRFLSEYAKKQEFVLFFKTFSFSINFRILMGIFIFAIAIIFFDKIDSYFHVAEYKLEFIIFCAGTFALFQIDFIIIALNSLFLHGYSSLGQLFYQTFRAISIFILFSVFGGKLTFVYTGELLAYGLGAVILWLIFKYKAHDPLLNKTCKNHKKIQWNRFLRFSAYNAITIPGHILCKDAMDFFVVAAMSTTSNLGIYALGSRASNMLLSIMPQNLLQTVIRPAFYHQYYSVEDKNTELNRMFRTLVVLIASFLFPALIFIGLHAESILTFIFKAKFAESTPIFLMLLGFNYFKIFELPSDLVLQAIEKVQARLYAQIFAIYNIVAAILLLPKFGLIGVAFATGSALMGKCLFWYFMARYYTHISICWGALLKITINTTVAAIIVYWVGNFGSSFIWVCLAISAGTIVYIAMFFFNNFLDDREKELVNQFCKQQIFKA